MNQELKDALDVLEADAMEGMDKKQRRLPRAAFIVARHVLSEISRFNDNMERIVAALEKRKA